jgi:hypothetical protein
MNMKWYFFKERVRYMIPYRIRDWYYKTCCFFNPRNAWLTKKIPKSWTDKDNIIEICVIESIREFVEGEGALEYYEETQTNPEYPVWQKEFSRELKEAYEIITVQIPALQNKLEEAWDKSEKPPRDMDKLLDWINNPKTSYEERYGDIDKLDEEIESLKTKVMTWAVVNRAKMWT